MIVLQNHIRAIKGAGIFYDKHGVQYDKNDWSAIALKKTENLVLRIFPFLGKYMRFGKNEVKQGLLNRCRSVELSVEMLNEVPDGWMGSVGQALAALRVTHKIDLLAQHARAAKKETVAYGRTEEDMTRLWETYAPHWSIALDVLREYENNPHVAFEFLNLLIRNRIDPPRAESPDAKDLSSEDSEKFDAHPPEVREDEFGDKAISALLSDLESIGSGKKVVHRGKAVSPPIAENRRRDLQWFFRGD